MMQNITTPPVNALPSFLQGVFNDVLNQTQASAPLIIAVLQAAMAEAAQGKFDIEIPGYATTPIALWVGVQGGSGIGKSPVESLLRKAPRDFEAKHAEGWKKRRAAYDSKMQVWATIHSELQDKLRKQVREGDPTELTETRLADHMLQKPQRPKGVKVGYSDATPSALKSGMAENWPFVSIASDEASIFFSGRLISEWGTFNLGWDGSRIIVDRKDEASCVTIESPRISMLLMFQEGVLQRYRERKGDEARDLGSLARFIWCAPYSTQGYRFLSDYNQANSRFLDEYNRRALVLLEMSVDEHGNPVSERTALTFSADARELFFSIHNQLEVAQQPGQWLSEAKDYASKAARNIARIAALLHLFEYGPGCTVISYDTLNRAFTIGQYFIGEFLRLFTQPPQVPQIVQDAAELWAWLGERTRVDNNRYVLKSDIQKFGPYRLRKAEILEGILAQLANNGQVGCWQLGKISYIDVLPQQPYDPASLDYAIQLHRSRRAPKGGMPPTTVA